MKKAVSLLILIILLFSTITVYSESNGTESEIIFRDIPWGSSIQDALAIIKKTPDSIREIDGPKMTTWSFDDYNQVVPIIYYSIAIPDLKVSGFKVRDPHGNLVFGNINLYFLPKISADQNNYSKTEGKLIGAEYCNIVPLNSYYGSDEELKEELIKKLNKLYGKNNDMIWQVNGAKVTMTAVTKEETYVSDRDLYAAADWYVSGGTQGYYKESTRTVTIGYRLIYASATKDIVKDIDTIDRIVKEESAREQEKMEKEEQERIRKEKEEKEKEEESRGYDGL